MELCIEIAVALLICGAVFLMIHAAKGGLVMPLRPGRGLHLTVTVQARGTAAELEQTLSGLLWMRGDADMDIRIEDVGLTPEAGKMAELLAGKYGVQFDAPRTAAGDREWTRAESTYK